MVTIDFTTCEAGSAVVARTATIPAHVLTFRNGEPRPLHLDREVTVVEILDAPVEYSTSSSVSLTCQPAEPTGAYWLGDTVILVILVAAVTLAGRLLLRAGRR